jgi:hypothetical protein
MRILPVLLILSLIVILDPYQGIDYDRINVYVITKSYRDSTITVTGTKAETYYAEDTYQDEYEEQVDHFYNNAVFDYYNR